MPNNFETEDSRTVPIEYHHLGGTEYLDQKRKEVQQLIEELTGNANRIKCDLAEDVRHNLRVALFNKHGLEIEFNSGNVVIGIDKEDEPPLTKDHSGDRFDESEEFQSF